MKQNIEIPFGGKTISAYVSYPSGSGKYPGVILIHEIWGLNQHIQDVSDRLSNEGYIVVAPDLLKETGVVEKFTPDLFSDLSDPQKAESAREKMMSIMAPINSPVFVSSTIDKIQEWFNFLEKDSKGNGDIAVMGFCFGGSYSFSFAVSQPKLKAAIPFYGRAPENVEEIEKIKCPILAFYGEHDEALMAHNQLPWLKEQMKKLNKDFEAVVYKDAGHAFFNNTNKERYNAKAASDSWNNTLEFLSKHLKK